MFALTNFFYIELKNLSQGLHFAIFFKRLCILVLLNYAANIISFFLYRHRIITALMDFNNKVGSNISRGYK